MKSNFGQGDSQRVLPRGPAARHPASRHDLPQPVGLQEDYIENALGEQEQHMAVNYYPQLVLGIGPGRTSPTQTYHASCQTGSDRKA
jgi:hypothetical protein